MGTWSIDPSGTLASIDSAGKVTYQEHTEDTNYTITYQDDTCGTITKSLTIKKCSKQGIKVKVVDTKFGVTTANYASLYTDYEGIGTVITVQDIEVNGPAKDCDADPKFINTNITKAIVQCGDDYYSATYAPSKIENGQTYTLTLDKKVKYISQNLYFNLAGVSSGTPGQDYVFNYLEVRVKVIKAGQTLYDRINKISCPCTQNECEWGSKVASINFGFSAYVDAGTSPDGAIIQVDIANASARDKDNFSEGGQKCNYQLKNVECPEPGWSGSMQSWTGTYQEGAADGAFNMSFQ